MMLRRVATAAIAFVALLFTPAHAVTFPMTAADIQAAADLGKATSFQNFITLRNWKVRSVFEDRAPEMTFETPFFAASQAASYAQSKFDDPLPAAAATTISKTISFRIVVESELISGNTDPGVIIVLNDTTIHAVKIDVDDPTPEADGFYRSISATFKAASVPKTAFTVKFGNIDDNGLKHAEYYVDPTLYR